jgi:phosphoglucosamine mutase
VANSNRLFGTDGIRGTAGQHPLDPPTVRRVGAALVRALKAGHVLPDTATMPHLLVGRDTRESGAWIEAELAHGASGEVAAVTSAGVVPTPAIAYLTRTGEYDAGIVISASHNPYEDNGIKVFSGRGEKFTERVERQVEAIVADQTWNAVGGAPAPVAHADLLQAYLDHLAAVFPEARTAGGTRLPGSGGISLAVDCANGATTTAAPRLFESLGFTTTVIGNRPDGRNINLDCGSTHPERLARTVVERGCNMGVAFDGDGDRAIFVDHQGRIVDGDAVMLMCARHMKAQGRLNGNAIVATVMSNIGLEIALRDSGIALVRCPVGDKYVMEEMISRGISMGGEQSGHIIFSDHLFTGDGIATALNVLRTIADTGRELADLASELVSYPQVLVNVRVRERKALPSVPEIAEAMQRIERRLDGQGRLLVRYSGTEPLVRVMIEGKDQQEIQAWAQEIADTIKQHLG